MLKNQKILYIPFDRFADLSIDNDYFNANVEMVADTLITL